MFKKKRIVLLCVLAIAVYIGWNYGAWIALGGLLLLMLMLGSLHAFQMLTAHKGFEQLKMATASYGYDASQQKAADLFRLSDGELTFVVMGDTRNKMKMAGEVYRMAANEKPAVIFHTGDIIRHGTASEFLKNHIPLMKGISDCPVVCSPGNHERGSRRDFAAFKELYGDERFSFKLGDSFFVGFNNSTRDRVSKDDLTFLEKELSESSARHKFVFFHIPPAFFEATFVNDTRRRGFKKNADEMHAILVKHAVSEVFMAHIHGYATEVIDGVRYTLTAGGGAPLSRRIAPDGQCHHYLVLNVTADGDRISRELVRLVDGTWVRSEVT